MLSAMARCWSCGKVKGKRSCPARGGELICSKCCGTKRRVEIQCPEDCPFLHGADPNWNPASRQKEEARLMSSFADASDDELIFMLFIHQVLFEASDRFFSLSDEELEDVVRACAKTLETEEKGIVYAHHTSSPHLDVLARWLVGVANARAEIPGAPSASARDVRRAFELLARAIGKHAASRTAAQPSYLETAKRVFGPSLAEAPKLVLPEGLEDLPGRDLIVPP